MLIFTKPHCRLLVASMRSFLWGFPSIWGEKVWSAKRLARRKFWLKNPKPTNWTKDWKQVERGPLWVKAVLADPLRWWRASPLLGSQQILTISKSALAFPTCLVKFKNKRKVHNFLSLVQWFENATTVGVSRGRDWEKCNFLFNPSNNSCAVPLWWQGLWCWPQSKLHIQWSFSLQ